MTTGPTGSPADVETALRCVWSVVLDLERVAIDDDFFELGGDSMLVLDMLTRAQEIGVDLAVDRLGEFLQEPTCGRLLELTGRARAS